MIEIFSALIDTPQHDCLKEAIYHEARNQNYAGQLYVGFVIENRVAAKNRFNSTFCDVIYAPYQFSYTHEIEDKTMYEAVAKDFSYRVAFTVLNSRNPLPCNAFYYHHVSIKPDWDWSKVSFYKKVDDHIFYTENDYECS